MEIDVTQDSMFVLTKIDFCGTAIAKYRNDRPFRPGLSPAVQPGLSPGKIAFRPGLSPAFRSGLSPAFRSGLSPAFRFGLSPGID
ncbi:hypothetical protein RhiirA1_469207 [Rhizophagus irregularis]|uniref:Uncharacterized protein n=1 Tax=Rhizophagus irregularis TaxID=588596 RepID=A0A2N0R8G7_9GLOM|nr:hypothetical protein RhiirA1_469207 [Rhizophagus irregularis]